MWPFTLDSLIQCFWEREVANNDKSPLCLEREPWSEVLASFEVNTFSFFKKTKINLTTQENTKRKGQIDNKINKLKNEVE